MKDINETLEKLKQSKFRNSFHLKQEDLDYIKEKGIKTIKEHTRAFIDKNLTDVKKFVDGKQTPTKGHPVFIAQHATATCCRGCLNKWWGIEKKHILTDMEKYLISLIIIKWLYEETKSN